MVLPHRRKDFEYRARVQAIPPATRKSPTSAGSPPTFPQERGRTTPPIRPRTRLLHRGVVGCRCRRFDRPSRPFSWVLSMPARHMPKKHIHISFIPPYRTIHGVLVESDLHFMNTCEASWWFRHVERAERSEVPRLSACSRTPWSSAEAREQIGHRGAVLGLKSRLGPYEMLPEGQTHHATFGRG